MKIKRPRVLSDLHRLNNELIHQLGKRRYVILTDETVSALWLHALSEALSVNAPLDIIETESGEAAKSIEICNHIWQHLLETGMERGDVLVCFGGGSVCDLGGFIASTYKRGVGCIYIPTTLLAMTDAAIGGKNGIDFSGIKNIVGTIRMPESTLIYPGFCASLPEEELLSGWAEVVKHSIISGGNFFDELLRGRFDLSNLPPRMLNTSIAVKMRIVRDDPFEQGNRMKLNFGHTIGHAIEAASAASDSPVPHGIAVAMGMQVELRLSLNIERINRENADKINRLLMKYFLPESRAFPEWQDVLHFMKQDKKMALGSIRLALPTAPGGVELFLMDDFQLIETAYRQTVDEL